MSESRKKSEMRSFEDSAKSKKTIASMIENNNQQKPVAQAKVGKAPETHLTCM